MVTLQYEGRLSNNIIQFLAGYFFAKKNNFYFNPELQTIFNNSGSETRIIKQDQLPLIGHLVQHDLTIVNDANFLDLFFSTELEIKHYHFVGFFQQRKFLEYIKPFIGEILDIKNEFKQGELFVHYRIGDLIYYERDGLPIWTPREYFDDAISKIDFKKGWISSDTPEHPHVCWLINKYKLEICKMSPLDTILFAKDCEYLVLSEYTFSGMIGYLSKGSNVWCNRRELWSITPETIQSGFDNYNLLRWNYDADLVAVNSDHLELNTLYDSLSTNDERLRYIRYFSYNSDTIFEISSGTALETIALFKAYPQNVTSYYLNDPINSGTDVNYVSNLARTTNIKYQVTSVLELGEVDCLVITVTNDFIVNKVLSNLSGVRKRVILSKELADLTRLVESNSFRLVESIDLLVFDRIEN